MLQAWSVLAWLHGIDLESMQSVLVAIYLSKSLLLLLLTREIDIAVNVVQNIVSSHIISCIICRSFLGLLSETSENAQLLHNGHRSL